MELADLVKAYLMNQVAHTQGHMGTAYDMRMSPAYVDYKRGVEVVPEWVSRPGTNQQRREATQWHGAGFTGQQDVGKKLEGTNMEVPYNIMQGLYKLGYLAGVKPSAIEGDPSAMERISGNKYTKPALTLSALANLYKAKNPDSKYSLDFITPEGAPGLMATTKF